MRIAFVGQRGIPATYGGVERYVEEISTRLAARGHDVTVFTRPEYTPRSMTNLRGVRLVSVPTIATKHLDAPVHSLLASARSGRRDFDVLHYQAVGPGLFSFIAHMKGLAVVTTVHGAAWRAPKWGRVAVAVLNAGRRMVGRVSDVIICVSPVLLREFKDASTDDVVFIPNGVSAPTDPCAIAPGFPGITGPYALFVGRLSPEKGVDLLVDAWRDLDMPLVIAGDGEQSPEYARAVRESAPDNVTFVGSVYGDALEGLFAGAEMLVLPSYVEGMPLVLLESLARGVPFLASDIEENRAVLGDAGSYFASGDIDGLRQGIDDVLANIESVRQRQTDAFAGVAGQYDWDAVTLATERAYERAIKKRSSR